MKTFSSLFLLFFVNQALFAESGGFCYEHEIEDLIDSPLNNLFKIRVKTASQYPEYLGSTPANILVIDQAQIQTRRYHNLLDLLQDQPSVDVHKYNDPTRLHSVNFRGLYNSRGYLILQDGVRITMPDGDNLAITDNFPLYYLERVEILYGPAAAIYGADAFTGVINLISKIGDKTTFKLAAGQGGAQQYRYAFGHGALKNGWKMSMGAYSQREDLSAQRLAEYPDYFTMVDAQDFAANTVIPADDRSAFSLHQSAHHAFARLDYEKDFSLSFFHSDLTHGSSAGDELNSTLYDRDTLWRNYNDSLSMRYSARLSPKLNTETSVQYLRHELESDSQFKNIFTNFTSGYKYAKGEQWNLSQRFDYCLNQKQRLVGGLSYEATDALPRTTDLSTPYQTDKAPEAQGFVYENTDIPIQISQMRYRNIGAYLQLHSTWNKTFSSVIGLRFDKNSRYEGSFNPRLGLIYKPNQRTLIKLLYGEAFRAPSANEMLRQFGSFSGERNAQGQYVSNFFATPNYDLRPETLRSLELNLHYVFNKKFNTQWSLYYNEVEDLINTTNTDEPVQFIPGAEILRGSIKANLDTAKIYGLDWQLNYRSRLAKRWHMRLWSNYSYINGGIDSNNSGILADLPYISPHKLKLGASFSYKKRFFITPKLYLISAANSPKLAENSDSERLQVPGYALFNLHLGAKNIFNNKGLNAYMDIENLSNIRYYHAGGGTSSTSLTQVPQSGRRFMLNLEWQF